MIGFIREYLETWKAEREAIANYQQKLTTMTRDRIEEMQEKIGTEPDGFWGPKSIAACKQYLRSLMPAVSPWPYPDQASLRSFYGQAGTEANLVEIKVTNLGILYEGVPVRIIRAHDLVADSLLRILTKIADSPHRGILTRYAGVYNFRQKRGGSSYSVHAYGAAIDLDPDHNAFKDSWPMKSTMPLEVMEIFATEGWKSAGAFWGYDAMHFEATR